MKKITRTILAGALISAAACAAPQDGDELPLKETVGTTGGQALAGSNVGEYTTLPGPTFVTGPAAASPTDYHLDVTAIANDGKLYIADVYGGKAWQELCYGNGLTPPNPGACDVGWPSYRPAATRVRWHTMTAATWTNSSVYSQFLYYDLADGTRRQGAQKYVKLTGCSGGPGAATNNGSTVWIGCIDTNGKFKYVTSTDYGENFGTATVTTVVGKIGTSPALTLASSEANAGGLSVAVTNGSSAHVHSICPAGGSIFSLPCTAGKWTEMPSPAFNSGDPAAISAMLGSPALLRRPGGTGYNVGHGFDIVGRASSTASSTKTVAQSLTFGPYGLNGKSRLQWPQTTFDSTLSKLDPGATELLWGTSRFGEVFYTDTNGVIHNHEFYYN